jgi:hypothetical protein
MKECASKLRSVLELASWMEQHLPRSSADKRASEDLQTQLSFHSMSDSVSFSLCPTEDLLGGMLEIRPSSYIIRSVSYRQWFPGV